MTIEINPKKIKGKWADGYALDIHTVRSTFLGYNAYGHPDFDTKRSPLGELLYKLKHGAREQKRSNPLPKPSLISYRKSGQLR